MYVYRKEGDTETKKKAARAKEPSLFLIMSPFSFSLYDKKGREK
jgi:hypothetical protein